MALIEIFHVVASDLPIDASLATDLPQGLLVALSAAGQIQACDSDTMNCIGLAGDSRSTGVSSFTPESGSALSRNPKTSLTGALVIGALGAQQRFSQNRIADQYNETLASGKMTVYHSGGEFWTDQYELVRSDGGTVVDFEPGHALYASGAGETIGTAGGEVAAQAGRFTDEPGTNVQVVGYSLTSPTSYPSGVPGTETGFNALPEGGNSLAWGTFLHIKLSV